MEGTHWAKDEESPSKPLGQATPSGDGNGNRDGENVYHNSTPTTTFGLQTGTSTESVDSVKTVKGGGTPGVLSPSALTPSYPFPKMQSLVTHGTPLETPGAHKPFTALSPTVAPSPAKMAKFRTSKDFRESGHVLPQTESSQGGKNHPGALDGTFATKPNILEIAVSLQSELGLTGWWNQVVSVLGQSFGAERATLSVATDATDVENVPWAQLATYSTDVDDGTSKVTNDPDSSQSSLRDTFSPILATTPTDRTTNLRNVAFASSGSQPVPNRPRLESRHSYAGYSSKQKNNSASDLLGSTADTGSSQRSSSKVAGLPAGRGEKTIEEGVELREELLEQHDAEERAREFFSDYFHGVARPLAGRVLQPVQPLESEADPLITTAGVVKVLRRQNAVVLTREYREKLEDYQRRESGQAGSKGSSKQSSADKKKSKSPGAPLSSPKLSHSQKSSKEQSSSSSKPHVSKRHSTGSNAKSSAHQNDPKLSVPTSSLIAYEDYEQFPGTPWAQSPAPSPAPQTEADENPFFSNAPDQGAFDEQPAEYEYTEPAQIPAIGLDRAQTIIQLPLIHPSGPNSQLQRSATHRADLRPKGRSRTDRSEKSSSGVRSSPNSETMTQRKVPIAILSIQTSAVPYSQELIDSLNELTPFLATTFYAARMHTQLVQEVHALSRRRSHTSGRINLRDEQSNVSTATGLSFLGSLRDRAFSPISPASTASTSPHSNLHSPKGSLGSSSTTATPGEERNQSSAGRNSARNSPAVDKYEKRGDYFEGSTPRQVSKGEPTSPGSTSRLQSLAKSMSAKKNIFHSHGANFANTQPSLPSATSAFAASTDADNMDVPQDVVHVFKEPSSSILRTMIDNGATQQFIAEADTGNLVWANSKFMAYRNASKENIHEQLWKNIYYKDMNGFRAAWYKSLETGDQLSYQVRLKRFDGQHRYFHIRFLPLKDKYGLTKYWHGQAMDIHELYEAQAKALKSKEKAASEAKYRAIANSLPVIVFAASVPTGMTFANTQWLSYSGQALEEALGFGFLNHVHPEDLNKCRFPGIDSQTASPIDAFKSRGNPLVRSESGISSTGESDTTSITDQTVKAGTPYAQPDELDIPSELLRGLANDGIIMCAKDGQGHLSITTEMRLKNHRGEYRWHLVQGSYIDSVNFGQGEAQWFIACTDISNQKLNEAKIQDANSALETANLTLENEMHRRMGYLSSMSHEIRTPLNGIIGNLQFLINSGLNEANSEWAHSAQESARNMHDLVNDILDLSKAEANMLQLSSAWFNPREIMEQVMDMLCSKATEKRIEFVCECSEAVPKLIRGDPGRIRQVLLNLAGNSIKFTSYGEVVVNCSLMQAMPEDTELPPLASHEILVKWTVTDTGSGFTEEEKKLLFKPYSQIKNKSTRDAGGTGLGLILCKTMITLHGGLIDAWSKPGKGSVFQFFARFKARKHSTVSVRSGLESPAIASPAISGPSSLLDSKEPTSRRQFIPGEPARESPVVLSDSSSAMSAGSTLFRTSLRSSASTADSGATMSLSLPSPTHPVAKTGSESSLSSRAFSDVTSSSIAAPIATSKLIGTPPTISPSVTTAVPTSSREASNQAQDQATDPERSKFRPPMLSILVICPAEQARRVTCAQIKYVSPRSAPCNITSEAAVDAAERLMFGDDPITFTHVVFRVASDELLASAIRRVLDSPVHTQTSIVIISDQFQVKALAKSLDHLDFEQLNSKDRVKVILKPAHVYKLAKIFDPFNENLQITSDPKEAKRAEEKRLQKESYALFKQVLGDKGMRVMAVEDNSVQMNILCNFLQRICHLEVSKAWNGQECLDLYEAHEPGYFSVIVTDIEMPVVDGLTMCRRLREWEAEREWPSANVISLSANAFYEGWTQSSLAGFTHYCPKPVNFRDLGHIILELTDPNTPHKFLKDRQMPTMMLKKLGLLAQNEGNSDDSDDELDG